MTMSKMIHQPARTRQPASCGAIGQKASHPRDPSLLEAVSPLTSPIYWGARRLVLLASSWMQPPRPAAIFASILARRPASPAMWQGLTPTAAPNWTMPLRTLEVGHAISTPLSPIGRICTVPTSLNRGGVPWITGGQLTERHFPCAGF